MTPKPFNQKQYEDFYQIQIEGGVPVELAKKAAQIIASDDPYKPNLGRSPEEQEIINSAHTWYLAQRGRTNEKS